MYCVSGCKELKSLNCSWTAKDLKENVESQSKLYLRPIQKNLCTVSILHHHRLCRHTLSSPTHDAHHLLSQV